MSIDGMMQFRLAYLEAIAQSWYDSAYRNRMFECAWEALEDLKRPLPHWNIQLRLCDDTLPGNGFSPSRVGGWVGPNFQLQVGFPRAPTCDDGLVQAEMRVSALAGYYELYPTPFGSGVRHKAPAISEQDSSAGSAGEGMGHWSDALVLGGVLVRALALYWQDADFRQLLLQGGSAPHAPNKYSGGVMSVLEHWNGYTCPWNVDLYVVERDDVVWNHKQRCWTRAKDQPKSSNDRPPTLNELVLFVPRAPHDFDHWPIALAAYNETGSAYPLTCP